MLGLRIYLLMQHNNYLFLSSFIEKRFIFETSYIYFYKHL